MRLTAIKLAGFKSFVDPTTLHFPTNMTGVVGPNGCGKSNIIDAIRWVMGESAASRLRGESLTDVIFSGSSARKPVGQATVELIFDNADGSVQGEFANYAEISVKRVVTREGQSQYFLNTARCRRRDITDLFLGTGLGPRSYSIIEQGMISQIIEAKPEELRTHLEEAAGISKYKERRKETESRIRATRENLDRVRDVTEEVDKQLEHLKRQARAAERWKALKEEKNHKQGELHALEYRDLERQREARGNELSEAETRVEESTAGQRRVEAQLENARERHQAAGEHLNGVQAEVYKVGAEIARIEQQVQHNRDLEQRLQQSRDQAKREHAELSGHVQADREQAEALRRALAEGDPQRAELEQRKQQTQTTMSEAESRLGEWQQQWDTHTRDAGEVTRAADVERTRLDYLDRQSMDNARRRETLEAERKAQDLDALDTAAKQLAEEHDQQRRQLESLSARVDEHKARHQQLQDEERRVQESLVDARDQLQTRRGRLASLEALQSAALGQNDDDAGDWLQQRGLEQAARLGASLEVEPTWEAAVEQVLAGMLDGVLVDNGAHQLTDDLAALKQADMVLLDAATGDAGPAGSLASHARGPAAAMTLLADVMTADDVHAATDKLAALAPHQSVITPAGEWLGHGWARVRRGGDEQAGVLAREREIQQLRSDAADWQARVEQDGSQLEALRTQKGEAERARDDAQRELYQTHRSVSELAGRVQSQRGKIESARARHEATRKELAELAESRETLDSQTREARASLDAAVSRMAEFESRREGLEKQRRQLLEAREEARLDAREAADKVHTLALGMESKRSALDSLEQARERMQTQLGQLESRQQDIDRQLEQGARPLADLEAERQTCLDRRLVVDKQLAEARRELEECDTGFRRLDAERQGIEQRLAQLREQHSEKRLAVQALQLRSEQLAETITRTGLEIEPLLAELAEDADPTDSERELETLATRIARLEPVNLAAIQEYDEQSERKTYLDSQMQDLTGALETLEGAIRKIDRETRQLFKETFDRVNTGFQEMFPRLFGGGHAYLELTGEDLLDTGVAIMARPPGKRVANITLLSGGEKAMTAVALVFSIFRLNPAPFCLLDEVDAPLDEANVGRFSGMVEEMSEHVQFVFISHNKATMEAARQLCGVTMREPGVSRLVQVDLAEASRLAGAA